MTVRVRLQRFGRRNRPFYRVVVADSRAPRDGKFIELVGTYNPLATRSGMKEVTFKVDRIRYWISVGAQPSDRVAWLLGQFGILPPKVVPVARTKKIVPRKEWKELQQQQKAGGKGFHTSAAAAAILAAPQPSCYTGIGELNGSFSLAGLGASVDGGGGGGDGEVPEKASQNFLNAGDRFESPLSFRWATRETAAGGSSLAHSDSDAVGGDIATILSQMSPGGRDTGQQQQQQERQARSMGDSDAPPLSAFSPLHAVLASHLALLGPAACSTIGVWVDADGAAGAR